MCDVGGRVSSGTLMSRTRSQGFWLQDPGGPGAGVDPLVGGARAPQGPGSGACLLVGGPLAQELLNPVPAHW